LFFLSPGRPGPKINLNSFFNGAGGQAGGVSPTAIVVIHGREIAPGLQGCISGVSIVGKLPTVLSNVSLYFTNPTFFSYAPIYNVRNLGPGLEYVTVQVPADLRSGFITVTVQSGTDATSVANVPVTEVAAVINDNLTFGNPSKFPVQ